MSIRSLIAGVLAVVCLPLAAAAQDRNASIGGTVSALNMDSNTSVAYTASFDYRFTRVVGFELEMTYAPSLKSPFPGVTSQTPVETFGNAGGLIGVLIPSPSFSNTKGRTVILSNNVRVAIPTTAARIEPFFVAGGGVASVRHTADLRYTIPSIATIIGGPAGPPNTISQTLTSSSLGLALTLGGGVSIKAASHLWIDADLRLIRVLGDDDQNIGRFGAGARYLF